MSFLLIGPDDRIRTCGIFGYAAGFAVPDKIFGHTLILDFIDRCTKLLILDLSPAADKQFAQSKYLALLARCRILDTVTRKHKENRP